MAENPVEILFLMQQVSATLFSLSNKLQLVGDKYLGKLTSRQLMVMMAILHLKEDGPILNNIAVKLGTTRQNIKQLVNSMKKKGYIVTVPSPRDKRVVNVKITEAGKHATIECSEKGMIFFLDLFKEFSKDEMELLWGFLKKMFRFDGAEQNGFEEEAGFEMDEEQFNAQARLMKEFEKRRNK